MRHKWFVLGLLITLITPHRGGAAGIPVIDSSNLVQNIAQVGHMITQINNLRAQLENMLTNTTGRHGSWENLLGLLTQIDSVMAQGQALSYGLGSVIQQFDSKFPGFQGYVNFPQEYQTQARTVLDTLRNTMQAAQMLSRDFQSVQYQIQALGLASDSAVGRMQAIQAGNNIAALAAQQTVRLQQILLTQQQAQATFLAEQQNRDMQVRVVELQWMANGKTEVPTDYGKTGRSQMPDFR